MTHYMTGPECWSTVLSDLFFDSCDMEAIVDKAGGSLTSSFLGDCLLERIWHTKCTRLCVDLTCKTPNP